MLTNVLILLAIWPLHCTAFNFGNHIRFMTMRSLQMSTLSPPTSFKSASTLKKTCGAAKLPDNDKIQEMIVLTSVPAIELRLLPHLEKPLRPELFKALDYCIPILDTLDSSIPTCGMPSNVGQALLEMLWRATIRVKVNGEEQLLHPTTLWGMLTYFDLTVFRRMGEEKVIGDLLYAGPITINLTDLHTFLLICVDVFHAVRAHAQHDTHMLDSLHTKYAAELSTWEYYINSVDSYFEARKTSAEPGV